MRRLDGLPLSDIDGGSGPSDEFLSRVKKCVEDSAVRLGWKTDGELDKARAYCVEQVASFIILARKTLPGSELLVYIGTPEVGCIQDFLGALLVYLRILAKFTHELQTLQRISSDAREPTETSHKGDIRLLQTADGTLKDLVTIPVAAKFGGVSNRAIQKAAKDGKLKTTGNRTNRRVDVQSLLKYHPPEK